MGLLVHLHDPLQPMLLLEAQVQHLGPKEALVLSKVVRTPGAFFKLLAPSRHYCLLVQPIGPEGRHYEKVHLAVQLDLSPEAAMQGQGLQGLTLDVVVNVTMPKVRKSPDVLVVGGGRKAACLNLLAHSKMP
jgi:hypothetical protein